MNEDPNNLVIVTTTSDDREQLEQIASALVEQRLAACCQIHGPISSIYMWQGSVANTQEFGCTIKTTAGHIAAVKSKIHQMHKYDVPQIVVVKAIDVSTPYLRWVQSETGSAGA